MQDSPIVEKLLPCTCGSSDARVRREDGTEYCFACRENFKQIERASMHAPTTNSPTSLGSISSYRSYGISTRGISLEVVDHFDVKMSVDINGQPESHFYPYTKGGQVVAYKERRLPKEFRTHGDFKDIELFGQSRAMGRTLVITEGCLLYTSPSPRD